MEERPVQTATKEGEAGVMWQLQNQTPKAACCPMPFNTQHANVTQSPRGLFPVERTSLSANMGSPRDKKSNCSQSTYSSFNLAFSLGRPMYSHSSWKKILTKILLDDVVVSSLSFMHSRTWKLREKKNYVCFKRQGQAAKQLKSSQNDWEFPPSAASPDPLMLTCAISCWHGRLHLCINFPMLRWYRNSFVLFLEEDAFHSREEILSWAYNTK